MNQYNKTIMHRLWRRDTIKVSTPQYNKNRNKEPVFMQNLSSSVKIFKKKEDFYLKTLFTNLSPSRPLTSKSEINIKFRASEKMSEFQKEHEQLLNEEQQMIQTLKKFEKQVFFYGKTYLYTLFVRLSEIIEAARLKINNKAQVSENALKEGWEKIYDEAKQTLVDCYQNLIYFKKYDVIQLLNSAKRKQNNRIYLLVPPKNRKSQIILNPIQKLQSTKILKAISVQLPSKKQKLQSLLSKKLNKKQKKLETEKRKQDRLKIKDKKQNPYKMLYGILNLRPIKVDDNFVFRRDMQLQGIERNKNIYEQRKKWQKKVQQTRERRYRKY